MATFSQRMGLKPMQKPLQQPQELDQELRNALWSVLISRVWDYWEPAVSNNFRARPRRVEAQVVEEFVELIWTNLFGQAKDEVPAFQGSRGLSAYTHLRTVVMVGAWNEVYDLINFTAVTFPLGSEQLIRELNLALEKHSASFRFIDSELVQIHSPVEIRSVETALATAAKAVREHLERSLALLADRKAPDFRNSIKESISAVEAACQAVARKPGATLGECLKEIKKVHPLHPAFEQALLKLYGYTSDGGGIRHALTEEDVVPTYADAQFMLVSCSAFTNYLWTVAAESGIKI